MRRSLLSAAASVCLVLLFVLSLVFREDVTAGACEGLTLWYRYVLPALLPSMILIGFMIRTGTVFRIGKYLGPVMRRFPGVSAAGSFVVAAGFLSGYPMGAKTSAELVRSEALTAGEGAYLLSFCNNSSPMFLTGIFLERFVPDRTLHLPFFLILMAAPLLCSQLFRPFHLSSGGRLRKKKASGSSGTLSGKLSGSAVGSMQPQTRERFGQTVDACLTDGFWSITRVGLYMMLFGVLSRLLAALLPGAGIAKTLLLASLELTGGLSMLSALALPELLRYVLLMALVSFGGLCALVQSFSMLEGSGIRFAPYIIEKLITAWVTSSLTFLYLTLNG